MKIIANATALVLLATASAAAQNVDLRFSTWLPPKHGVHEGLEKWAESIREQSGGTIDVTLYPAEQLGRANDHYDMARDGIADLSFLNVGYQAGRFPIAEAIHLPFTVSSGIGGSTAFDSWYRPYAETEMADVKFCLGFVHEPGSLHAKTEIRTPDQMRGLNIRSAHATMANYVTALGGSNVRVSAPESRSALESGVADAVTFPWESAIIFGLDNVVSYSMEAPLYVSGFVWVMNQGTYDAMTDDQKTVMDAHCSTEWASEIASTWSVHEKAGHEALASKDGHTVYELTPDETAAWRNAAGPLRDTWLAAAGPNGAEALEALDAALVSEGAKVE
ncbi:TRAP transporter substrate-binding protein [Aliihoeflea sp. PC F10.4]